MALAVVPLVLASGCAWDSWWRKKADAAGPAAVGDSLVLRDGKLEAEAPPAAGSAAAELAQAHELYRQNDFAAAEKIYRKIAKNQKNPQHIAEEARYYEAECLRMQLKYPKACDTYAKLLNDFPAGAYREQALQRMFDIANYWLDDTRAQMEAYKEKREGKRFWVAPNLIHWDKTKPFFDEEGRALERLEQVSYTDVSGPLADKALFLAGSVKFYREDYKEADRFFSQLIERYPHSPLAPQALELAIIAKHLSTGGSDYDGRKVAEARRLVNTALISYPELAQQKRDFLERQLIGITLQQAEKEFNIAEFYRRTGHPGSAYFYYEIVRRSYPGTEFFDKATERMHELRAELEKAEQQKTAKGDDAASGSPPDAPETAPPPRKLPESLAPSSWLRRWLPAASSHPGQEAGITREAP
ncbi:MAG: tetratricopeptide repeat protein [Gemmataceae bacterium]|nr:tetratricopeptide repeat protein [Gemmataceae bacterium]MDW8267259.1 tetratricopeptide repeat protein [Gemmataceae bacterium]